MQKITDPRIAWRIVAFWFRRYARTGKHVCLSNGMDTGTTYKCSVTTGGLCWAAKLFTNCKLRMKQDIRTEWSFDMDYRWETSSETALLRAEWAERMSRYKD